MPNYGVEIECYVPRNIGQRGVADALNRMGVRAVVSGYAGRDYSVWQVKTDSSLGSPPVGYTGIEVVSPILAWNEDGTPHENLRKVSEYLVSIDAKVNVSCGGHVHVDVSSLDANGLARLVEIYYTNHGAISQTVLPARTRNNSWSRVNAYWGDAVARIRRNGMHDAHYIGGHANAINSDWYAQRGTLEFRQREGSINYYKITGWVGFLMAMVSAAADDVYMECTTAEDLAAHLIEGDHLSEVLGDWFLKRNLPRITSQIIEDMATARAAATARVSRLMSLQGVR
jgi:hypothetical protein